MSNLPHLEGYVRNTGLKNTFKSRQFRIFLGTFAASGFGFLILVSTSAILPSAEFMLAFYLLTGPNIAMAVAEMCSIWATHQRISWAESMITSWMLWLPVGVSGILFIPASSRTLPTWLCVGASLFVAISFRCYLLRLVEARRVHDYVQSQMIAATSASLRFVLSLLAIGSFWWLSPRWSVAAPGGWLSPSMLLVFGTALSYLAVGVPAAVRAFLEGRTRAKTSWQVVYSTVTFALFTVAIRSLVSAATHIPDQKWRPLLTVINNAVLVGGNLILSFALDKDSQVNTRKLLRPAWFICLALCLLFIPDVTMGTHGIAVALKLAVFTGLVIAASTVAVVFFPWHQSSGRTSLLFVLSAINYIILTGFGWHFGFDSFYLGAVLALLTFGAAFFGEVSVKADVASLSHELAEVEV